MFRDQDLHDLLEYKSSAPVLSIYLNLDPSDNSETQRLRLRSMLKDLQLPEDLLAVERYFDHEYDWTGKSVVVFSCAGDNYFKTYSLAVPLRSRVRVGQRPYVKPLADLFDSYGGYGVVLVDKVGARLFYFHLGELREQEGVMGEEVRHAKRGGASQSPGRRGGVAGRTNYVEEVTERNLKDAAEFAAKFFGENRVRRILIGGTDDSVVPLRSFLPKAWQSLVVGTFPMSMTASQVDVYERAMQAGSEAERQREERLVDAVITGAAKGRGGAVGLGDTLAAVHEGRVQTLVIQDGYRAPGLRCSGCGYISMQEQATCSFCGSSFERIQDAVELAVRKVWQDGGDVEVLHDDLGLDLQQPIGALLRY
jgi:peptide chain release factor subunit 1